MKLRSDLIIIGLAVLVIRGMAKPSVDNTIGLTADQATQLRSLIQTGKNALPASAIANLKKHETDPQWQADKATLDLAQALSVSDQIQNLIDATGKGGDTYKNTISILVYPNPEVPSKDPVAPLLPPR
jgi:hypothetical protein